MTCLPETCQHLFRRQNDGGGAHCKADKNRTVGPLPVMLAGVCCFTAGAVANTAGSRAELLCAWAIGRRRRTVHPSPSTGTRQTCFSSTSWGRWLSLSSGAAFCMAPSTRRATSWHTQYMSRPRQASLCLPGPLKSAEHRPATWHKHFCGVGLIIATTVSWQHQALLQSI